MSATAVCERPVATSVTLAQLLTRAHEDAQARGTADCPACGDVMERAGVQAVCSGCGTRLS